MDDIILFSDAEYLALKSAYDSIPRPNSIECLNYLNGILQILENNSFQMPLILQNDIFSDLSKAKQILEILCIDNSYSHLNCDRNVFALISHLSHLSFLLTTNTIKSATQTLHLKVNNLIVGCINKIAEYFKNKNLKLFKFI